MYWFGNRFEVDDARKYTLGNLIRYFLHSESRSKNRKQRVENGSRNALTLNFCWHGVGIAFTLKRVFVESGTLIYSLR